MKFTSKQGTGIIPLCFLLVLLTPGCSPETKPHLKSVDASLKTVYVDSYPLAYMAESVAGQEVNVVFPAPAGRNPADWTPSPDVISEFQGADLILLNGAGLSPWVQTSSLPESKTVDTSDSYHGELISMEGGVTHSHGPGGEHSHAGLAPTTWLDPKLAEQQVAVVTEALSRLVPEKAETFKNRAEILLHRLDSLHQSIDLLAPKLAEQTIIASHPVYQYLQRRYNLKIDSLHWEPSEAPTPEQVEDLKARQAASGARYMIWEAEPSAEGRQAAEDAGLISLVLNPAGSRSEGSDWWETMQQNFEVLRQIAGVPSSSK